MQKPCCCSVPTIMRSARRIHDPAMLPPDRMSLFLSPRSFRGQPVEAPHLASKPPVTCYCCRARQHVRNRSKLQDEKSACPQFPPIYCRRSSSRSLPQRWRAAANSRPCLRRASQPASFSRHVSRRNEDRVRLVRPRSRAGSRLAGRCATGGYILKRVDVLLVDSADRIGDHIAMLMRGEAPTSHVVQFQPRGRVSCARQSRLPP